MSAGQLVAIISTFVTLNAFAPDESLDWPLDADDPELEALEVLLDCCDPWTTT
jgi:hypothetical protein